MGLRGVEKRIWKQIESVPSLGARFLIWQGFVIGGVLPIDCPRCLREYRPVRGEDFDAERLGEDTSATHWFCASCRTPENLESERVRQIACDFDIGVHRRMLAGESTIRDRHYLRQIVSGNLRRPSPFAAI